MKWIRQAERLTARLARHIDALGIDDEHLHAAGYGVMQHLVDVLVAETVANDHEPRIRHAQPAPEFLVVRFENAVRPDRKALVAAHHHHLLALAAPPAP